MNNSVEQILQSGAQKFFAARALSWKKRQQICNNIAQAIEKRKRALLITIGRELKFTPSDTQNEVARAIRTFRLAGALSRNLLTTVKHIDQKHVTEHRIARGPLLAITPFSSPVSSPAHKIACGLLAGTSIIWKPSKHNQQTAKRLYNCIISAGADNFIDMFIEKTDSDLPQLLRDERIGIVSLTGGYTTGKQIIRHGGIKKYHMELTGGNATVIFLNDYKAYAPALLHKILDGIVAKNGQRCVSIKHIIIPSRHQSFINNLCTELTTLKNECIKKPMNQLSRLRPLISEHYAQNAEHAVQQVLNLGKFTPLLEFTRRKNFVLPTMYISITPNQTDLRGILRIDIPGPIVFVYLYRNGQECDKLLESFSDDYIHSGLQLSLFTHKHSRPQELTSRIIWGGIIVNDIPTFRDEQIPFGGFGRAGLGKESIPETFYAFTDPQILITPTTS